MILCVKKFLKKFKRSSKSCSYRKKNFKSKSATMKKEVAKSESVNLQKIDEN